MIRRMIAEDIEEVYGLVCELEEEELNRVTFMEIFMKILDGSQHICFVYETAGHIFGFIHLRWEEQLHHAGKVAEVMELDVAREYRSNGIGRALFEIGREWARDSGCIQLEVSCNQRRERSHAFYMDQGMAMTHYKFSLPLANTNP